MKTRSIGSGLLLLFATSTASWAAVTAEEAAGIQKTLLGYLGNKDGAVTVKPANDGYDITLNPMVFFAMVKEPGFSASMQPIVYHAVPQGNGLWKVDSSSALNMKIGDPTKVEIELQSPAYTVSGMFSEELAGFTQSTTSVPKMDLKERIVDATNGTTTDVNFTGTDITSVYAAKPDGKGRADVTWDMTFNNMKSVAQTSVAGGPAINLNYESPKLTYSGTGSGLSNRKLLDVVTWFQKYPAKADMIAHQAELKDLLKAAMPLFNNIKGGGKMEALKVTSPVGVVSFDSVEFNADINGLVKEGRFAEGFGFTGLQIPAGIAPAWSAGLIPNNMKFGFELSGFNAEAPATMFINEMDIAAPQPVPPGSEMKYLASFAPSNSIKMTVPPGEISAGLYTLSYEGTSEISFAGNPKVDAKIRMTGIDKVIAQLQQATSDPTAQQAMAVLFAAKGFSKPDGDALLWNFTMSPDGKMLVNGTDLSAMTGALNPPPPPQ